MISFDDFLKQEEADKYNMLQECNTIIKQKENIIKEVREKLIKSKEYQAVKSLGLNSKMSILIELEEMLDKESVSNDII